MGILVIKSTGPGAVIGSRLAAAGHEVTYLDHRRRAFALDFMPLVVKSDLGDSKEYVHHIEDAEIFRPYDLILAAMPAHGVEALAAVLPRAVAPGTVIVSLIDGIEHIARLEAACPDALILDGIHDIVVLLDEVGAAKHVGGTNQILIAARTPGETGAAEKVAARFAATELDVRLVPNVERLRWERMIRVVGVVGLAALMQVRVARIGEVDGDYETLWRLMQEGVAVALAAGQTIDVTALTAFMERLPSVAPVTINALLNRVERGDLAEINELVGQMRRAAHATNTLTPVLDIVAKTLAARHDPTGTDDAGEGASPPRSSPPRLSSRPPQLPDGWFSRQRAQRNDTRR